MTRVRRKGGERRRRQRVILFRRQKGLCYWCKLPMWMLPDGTIPVNRGARLPHNAATIDHLHPKHDPERGKHNGECTHVLACLSCNNGRDPGRFTKTQLWELSGAYPVDMRRPQGAAP